MLGTKQKALLAASCAPHHPWRNRELPVAESNRPEPADIAATMKQSRPDGNKTSALTESAMGAHQTATDRS